MVKRQLHKWQGQLNKVKYQVFIGANRSQNVSMGVESLLLYNICVVGGARGVMVIVAGNGHSDTSSILGRDWLHFT